MISDLGSYIARIFRRTCPDPFVIAILLTALTAVLALTVPGVRGEDGTLQRIRPTALLDAWRADGGLWQFLAFAMQMCLILVTGHALASAPIVRRFISQLASLPRSPGAAVAVVGIVAATAGVLHWGLALIVGALTAREVGRAMQARGVRVHYPLLAAAGYVGLLVWHGGLSGSAPFTVTTREGAARVLKPEYIELLGDTGIPLIQTVFSPMNLFVTGGLLIIIPIILILLTPRRTEEIRTIEDFPHRAPGLPGEDVPDAENVRATPASIPGKPGAMCSIPDFLNRSPIIAAIIAIPLLAAVWRYGQVTGLGRVGLNEINAFMLALGLLLHGSPIAYMRAVEEGARGCAGIIVQFPLYAGIMAMMTAAGLVTLLAGTFVTYGTEGTIPFMSFLAAGIVNLFVPSGGGQWGIQGPIALEAAFSAGIEPGKMVMAVAYGDQLTNMLQPFWALPLLAITGVQARDIVGYTAVVMLFAMAWMGVGLVVF